jgi:hypothetical protein
LVRRGVAPAPSVKMHSDPAKRKVVLRGSNPPSNSRRRPPKSVTRAIKESGVGGVSIAFGPSPLRENHLAIDRAALAEA